MGRSQTQPGEEERRGWELWGGKEEGGEEEGGRGAKWIPILASTTIPQLVAVVQLVEQVKMTKRSQLSVLAQAELDYRLGQHDYQNPKKIQSHCGKSISQVRPPSRQ